MDMTAQNVDYIAQRFPNAVIEVVEGGKTIKKIDFAILQQELSSEIIGDKQERYQFTWPEKRAAIQASNVSTSLTLRPVLDKSICFGGTKNIYIEGDNLEALRILREPYLGKVKMIYIDPPYNTGNDFIYEDDFSESQADYVAESGQIDEAGNRLVANPESNGRFHTDWLNMMYPRLRIAKDLLSDDGVIFISIDDNEIENLRKLCDEIFGEINFACQIPWQSRASMQNDTDFSVNHEYILIYAKNRRQENRRLRETNAAEWHGHDSFVFRPIPLNSDNYENPDRDPRGPWKADPFDAPHIRPNLTYAIVNPNTGEEHWPPKGRCWRTEKQTYERMLADGRIVFGKNGTGRPQLKVFYEEKKDFGSIDYSWFSAERVGTTTQGTKEVQKLFDGEAVFDMPKPTSLLKKLITLANLSEDDIVMDFFSGSASTADAVLQLNAETNSKYRFILIQLPESVSRNQFAVSRGYQTICDIGEDRIRRAAQQIKSENPLLTSDLDDGFRVFKVDTSNMRDVFYNPTKAQQSLIVEDISNIKPDRTSLDLVFQCMLELGAELSSSIEEKTIDDKQVFLVNDNYLIACFASEVTEEIIRKIAEMKPIYAVFRDSCFASDSANINCEQLFKAISPSTSLKVL